MQQIWRRIKEERNRPKRVEINTRGQNNMDRSKAFLVLGTAVVLCGFAFLALFSTSGAEKRAQERRTKPSLGRPEARRNRRAVRGSTIPLLNADQGAGDQNSEQLSPDDILATSRRAQIGKPAAADNSTPDEYALNQVPPVNDPALEAYRRQNNYAYTPPPPPPRNRCGLTGLTTNERVGGAEEILPGVRAKHDFGDGDERPANRRLSLPSLSERGSRRCCRPAAGWWHDCRPPSVAP